MTKPPHVVLLVEDSPADIKITERAIRESDMPVELVVVRDGQEAVDYLFRQGGFAGGQNWKMPELILLDLNLPRMTGCQVLERLREDGPFRAIPVVVLTTSRREEDVQAVYAAGGNTYIQKPQEYRQFVEALRIIGRYWLDTALLPAPQLPN